MPFSTKEGNFILFNTCFPFNNKININLTLRFNESQFIVVTAFPLFFLNHTYFLLSFLFTPKNVNMAKVVSAIFRGLASLV